MAGVAKAFWTLQSIGKGIWAEMQNALYKYFINPSIDAFEWLTNMAIKGLKSVVRAYNAIAPEFMEINFDFKEVDWSGKKKMTHDFGTAFSRQFGESMVRGFENIQDFFQINDKQLLASGENTMGDFWAGKTTKKGDVVDNSTTNNILQIDGVTAGLGERESVQEIIERVMNEAGM
jgi:hypothetical protein